MNLLRRLRVQRRNSIRTLELAYATVAGWIPPTYPDFMCIGAPRAATTWLHTMLRKDPQIYLPKAKELHFFDDMRPRGDYADSGLRWYRSFFFEMNNPVHLRWYWMQFLKGKGRLKGEITPSYSMLSKDRVRFVLEKIPELKVIYLIRNPIDRAWSTLRQVVLYQLGRNQDVLKNTAWVLRTIEQPVLLEGGNYRRTIETWGGMMPERNILYVFYDDIVSDPRSALDKIYTFLNLDMPRLLELGGNEKRVNAAPGLSIPEEVRSRLAEYYEGQIEYLEKKFGRDLGHWTQRACK